MVAPKSSEADFIQMFEELGPHQLAKRIGGGLRAIFRRRAHIEKKIGRALKVPEKGAAFAKERTVYPHRLEHEITDGIVLVGSDAHIWPGPPSTAMRAFTKFCKEMKPRIVVMNGDALDGARISRHPPIGWADTPKLVDEIEACKEQLHALATAAGKAHKIWSCGNHDARFESRLAQVAPDYAKIHGTSLHHHFPLWQPCWSAWINDDVVVKHRIKGGIHATHNNTMWAGKTTVTGHLHSLKVTPFSDYRGTRFGIDCGCLADPYGPAFVDYTEDSPRNWRAGFVVLTFHKGRLMWPEVVAVVDQATVEFRGQRISV